MSHNIVTFHFNPLKCGQIIRQYAKNRGISQEVLAARIGISYDTMGNIYAGKVQKIPFEYLFKISVVLAVPLEVLMMLMLKDEDIDFADQVLLYDTVDDKAVPVEDVVPTMVAGSVPESVADAAASAPMPDAPIVQDHARSCYTAEDVRILLERMSVAHAAHIHDLKEQFAHEREAAARTAEQLYTLAKSMTGSGY